MKGIKILAIIAALVLIGVVASDAWAGCSPARLFRSQGKPNNTNNVTWSVVGTDPGANEIARLWDSDDANNSNSGLTGPDFGNLCPASVWWLDQGENKKVDGFHGGTGCSATGCPADNMTVLVEEYDVNGPPGIGGTAYYMAAMVYETPVNDRWWDYGLVDGVSTNTTFEMLEFPRVDITSSSSAGGETTFEYNLADQSGNVLTWETPNGMVYPTDRVITEWQLLQFSGSDPGRLRSSGWVVVQRTPYVPGGTSASFAFPWLMEDRESFAIGLGFNGGASGVIDSALVGEAITIEIPPPIFTSPECGSTIRVEPGETVEFTVTAEDAPERSVTLDASGLPPGAIMDPALPITGNPVLSMFAWTTDVSHSNTIHVAEFTATNEFGSYARCRVGIEVSEPTLVTLVSFTAIPGDGQVTLNWTTASEIDNAGFYLLRSNVAARGTVRLHKGLIPARGDVFTGADYTYVDETAVNGVEYEYTLVDVDLYETETIHPPVRAIPNPPSPPVKLLSPARREASYPTTPTPSGTRSGS